MTSTYIGADEEDLIFQEAYSGKLACEQKKNGTGIGLYLARQLAQLNGGDLTLLCRRKPGDQLFSANTFVLALPARI
jgi:signal transduction histidine kinase